MRVLSLPRTHDPLTLAFTIEGLLEVDGLKRRSASPPAGWQRTGQGPVRRQRMSGKPAARLGDPTDCPKTGHTNPIAAGSPDVLFDGLPAARMGDASACGGAMASAVIPNVLIDGKPAAGGQCGESWQCRDRRFGTVVIGSGHSPAPFLAPEVLSIATAAIAAATNSVKSLLPATPLARAWQEEPGTRAVGPGRGRRRRGAGRAAAATGSPGHHPANRRVLRRHRQQLANAAVTEQCRRDDLQLVGERTLQEVIDYCQSHGFSDSNGDGYFTQLPTAATAMRQAMWHGCMGCIGTIRSRRSTRM